MYIPLALRIKFKLASKIDYHVHAIWQQLHVHLKVVFLNSGNIIILKPYYNCIGT